MTTWLDDHSGMMERVAKWNRSQASKHLRQTLSRAAKIAQQYPSAKFCATIDPTPEFRGYGRRKVDPNKLLADLQKLGVTPDQLITP